MLGCGLRITLFAYLISSCPFKRRSCLPKRVVCLLAASFPLLLTFLDASVKFLS